MAEETKKKPKKKLNIWLWLVILIVIVGGLLIGRSVMAKKAGDKQTARIQKGEVTEELILSGAIQAEESAKLTFPTAGEISKVYVKEGEAVKKGQVLAQLNTAILYAAYERAVSDLRQAQATVDRALDEVSGHDKDENHEQKEDRTIAEVARDKAYRSLTIAQKNLAEAILRSPIDGVVTTLYYPFAGVNVLSSQPIVEIVNPNSLYFEVNPDQTEIVRFKQGNQAMISLDAYPEEIFKGIVKDISISPQEDEVGTVYSMKLDIMDITSNGLKLGMTGDAKFELNKVNEVLYVPAKFVNNDKEGKYLLINNPKNKVYVEVGVEGEDRVQVSGEISEGDVIYD